MIEHPNRKNREEVESMKRAAARREYENALHEHETQIDALLKKHLESPVEPFVEYPVHFSSQVTQNEVLKKYADAGWHVSYSLQDLRIRFS